MRSIYLDECKKSPFLLVGVTVNDLDKTLLRKRLNSNLLRGQRSMHFKNESPRRRRHLVSEFSRLGFKAVVFRSTLSGGLLARTATIASLVNYTGKNRINQLVFELDESSKAHDEKILAASVSLVNGRRELSWEHRGRNQEPLLWVADAVAWCVNRGGEWERLVRPMIVETIEC